MIRIWENNKLPFLALLFILCPFFLPAEDQRSVPMDMNLIIDGSSALSTGREGAVQWLCDSVVDGMLRAGDRLTIWVAADTARVIFSGAFMGGETGEAVKEQLRSLVTGGNSADYTGALRDAAARTASIGDGRIAYTLLVSAPSGSFNRSVASAADYLRYSRVQEFAGWRAMVVGLGIGPEIHRAASTYGR